MKTIRLAFPWNWSRFYPLCPKWSEEWLSGDWHHRIRWLRSKGLLLVLSTHSALQSLIWTVQVRHALHHNSYALPGKELSSMPPFHCRTLFGKQLSNHVSLWSWTPKFLKLWYPLPSQRRAHQCSTCADCDVPANNQHLSSPACPQSKSHTSSDSKAHQDWLHLHCERNLVLVFHLFGISIALLVVELSLFLLSLM